MSEVLVSGVRNSRERLEKSATKSEGKDVRRYQSINLLNRARTSIGYQRGKPDVSRTVHRGQRSNEFLETKKQNLRSKS